MISSKKDEDEFDKMYKKKSKQTTTLR